MRIFTVITATLALLTLSGCDGSKMLAGFRGTDAHDRSQNLTRDDFRGLHDVKKLDEKKGVPALLKDGKAAPAGAEPLIPNLAQDGPPIPDVAEILAAPRPPKIQQSKLVSIAVTDDVPLRDVLFELSRLADVDIEIGNNIEGGINFRAKDKPFNEVIERIADLAGLRYHMKNGVLRVENDTPYIKNYTLDFLNIVRSSQSTVSLNTDVLSSDIGGNSGSGGSSGGSGGSGGSSSSSSSGLQTGTTASIDSKAESDLWTALDASIAEILSYKAPSSAAPSGTPNAAATSGGTGYVINRQAGVVSVNGTQAQHEMVAHFIDVVAKNISAQVVIEAKIIEVTLNDNFRTGISWDAVLERARTRLNFIPNTSISPTSGIAFGLRPSGNNAAGLDDIVQLTQEFGTTRTLSSPRLHAINNQQSVLTFAQNRIFFTCNQTQGESTTSGGGGTTTVDSAFTCTRGSVPIGILLSILPAVNLDTQEITLSVRPTLSRQVSTVPDPGTAIAAAASGATIENAIPVVEVRELDSVMKIKNGGIMVIGGLLEEVGSSNDAGVPGISEIPWLGNAFKSRDEASTKRELIIFIKATIVDSGGYYHPTDRKVYEKFTTDSRPL